MSRSGEIRKAGIGIAGRELSEADLEESRDDRALVRQIDAWGFDFLDCQVHTEHTAALGAREWPRDVFLRALARALERPTRRGRWRFDPEVLASLSA